MTFLLLYFQSSQLFPLFPPRHFPRSHHPVASILSRALFPHSWNFSRTILQPVHGGKKTLTLFRSHKMMSLSKKKFLLMQQRWGLLLSKCVQFRLTAQDYLSNLSDKCCSCFMRQRRGCLLSDLLKSSGSQRKPCWNQVGSHTGKLYTGQNMTALFSSQADQIMMLRRVDARRAMQILVLRRVEAQ